MASIIYIVLFHTLIPFSYLLLLWGASSFVVGLRFFYACSHEPSKYVCVFVCVCVLSVHREFITHITSCIFKWERSCGITSSKQYCEKNACVLVIPLMMQGHIKKMVCNENPIYDVSKKEEHAETMAAMCDSLWRLKHNFLFSTMGKAFSPSTEFITFQSCTSAASLPLHLWLSSCWLFRKNDMMTESSLPFPSPPRIASHPNKSFLFISGSILTGCRWEAKMSTRILTAAGSCGTLLGFFPLPFLFPSWG